MAHRKNIFVIGLAFILLVSSCASSRRPLNKKLDPNKPIPCPQKDC